MTSFLEGDKGLAPVGFLIGGFGAMLDFFPGSPMISLVARTLPPNLPGVGLGA